MTECYVFYLVSVINDPIYMYYDIEHAIMTLCDVCTLCVRCYSPEFVAHTLATIFFRLLRAIAGSQGIVWSSAADTKDYPSTSVFVH